MQTITEIIADLSDDMDWLINEPSKQTMKNTHKQTTMKAKYSRNDSLHNSETWQLSNGWKAQKSFTWQGIPFVSKLVSPDGEKSWHCSSGLDFRENYSDMKEVISVFESLGQIPLPDFAKPFVGKAKDFNDRPMKGLVSVFFSDLV